MAIEANRGSSLIEANLTGAYRPEGLEGYQIDKSGYIMQHDFDGCSKLKYEGREVK